jgi:hypothetical protein
MPVPFLLDPAVDRMRPDPAAGLDVAAPPISLAISRSSEAAQGAGVV